MREECRLRMFEKRVLRRIFGPKRNEVTREWRKLHNEELNDLYSPPSIVRVIKSGRMRWVGACRVYGGEERHIQEKPEGKRPLGRPWRRWVGKIQEVGCGGMDWIELAQDRGRLQALVNVVMNLCVP